MQSIQNAQLQRVWQRVQQSSTPPSSAPSEISSPELLLQGEYQAVAVFQHLEKRMPQSRAVLQQLSRQAWENAQLLTGYIRLTTGQKPGFGPEKIEPIPVERILHTAYTKAVHAGKLYEKMGESPVFSHLKQQAFSRQIQILQLLSRI